MSNLYTPELIRAARAALEAVQAWPEDVAELALDMVEERLPGIDRELHRPEVMRRLREANLDTEHLVADCVRQIEQGGLEQS